MSASGKTENAPVVSVVIGAYNAENFIEETLASALDQTLTEPYEVILVDDGSTDATASIAKRFADRDPRVRFVHKENGGSASARNAGAKAARGEFLAILDADDRCHRDRLRRLLQAFRDDPTLGIVGSWARLFDGSGVLGVIRPPLEHEVITKAVLSGSGVGFVLASMMCRSALFFDAGGYDERYPTSEDYELVVRLAKRTRCANVPEPLYDVRVHSASKTFRMFKQQLYRGLLTRHALELGGIDALNDDQVAILRKKTLETRDLKGFGIDEMRVSATLWGGYLHRIRQLLLVRDTEHAERFLAEAADYARMQALGSTQQAKLGVLRAHATLQRGAPVRALASICRAAASDPRAATSEAALTLKRELLRSYARYRESAV